MENRPLFLGKGRGRGRAQNRGYSEWNKKPSPILAPVLGASEERLKAVDKIKDSVKKYVDYGDDDFSSDEEVNDAEILSNTLKDYEKSSSHGKTSTQPSRVGG